LSSDKQILKISETNAVRSEINRKPTGRELMSQMMLGVKIKVRKGLNERLEALSVKHSELEDD